MDSYGFAVIATGVILFGLVSKRLEGTMLTAPMVFVAFGLVTGEAVFGAAKLEFGHEFIRGLAEITLILVLFSDASRIDLKQLRRDHNLPVRTLLVGMPLTIVLGAGLALAIPLGLEFWEAALLAAILAPTDAALGQTVVASPLVPVRIRQALNVESGLNDGIEVPVVLLFASLASAAQAGAGEERDWLVFGAMQVILGPIAGLGIMTPALVELNATVGADVDAAVAADANLRLIGYSIAESAGTPAIASCAIVNGATGAAAGKVAYISLEAGCSQTVWMGPQGVTCPLGLSIDWIAGELDIVLYYTIVAIA